MCAEITWALTDHACRKCGGRVLRSVTGAGMTPGGNSIHRCADCGAQTWRMGPNDICWCGFSHKGSRDNPYRCIPVSMAANNPEIETALSRCGINAPYQNEIGIVLYEDLKEALRNGKNQDTDKDS